jgi:hypothetical protein
VTSQIICQRSVIGNATPMHEGREFAGHSDIRTTDLYFSRRDDDAEHAARNIRIRVPTRQDS